MRLYIWEKMPDLFIRRWRTFFNECKMRGEVPTADILMEIIQQFMVEFSNPNFGPQLKSVNPAAFIAREDKPAVSVGTSDRYY